MSVSNEAAGADAPLQMKTARRIALAMCAVLVGIGGSMSTSWAAESVEADKKSAEMEARETAERERKLNDARKRLDEAAREVADLSRQISEDAMPQVAHIMSRMGSRSMLGVNIGSNRDQKRKDGVEIVSVSPGGPAAEAGLKAGDVIVAINDKPLKQEGSDSPHEKLLAAMREVKPEEKVKVRYLRDGKAASATVVARRTDSMFTMPLRMQGFEPPATFAFMRSRGIFGSAELVALTPKLGQYFGTDKGLLVVRAPADSRLQLEDGDVIVDIDGRVPTSASHAVRILSSYQPDEKLKLNVVRMKKRMTFDITIPEDVLEHRFEGAKFHELDDVFVPATPAVPPAPPAPVPPRDDTA
jgi:C-terminal processing protease CtpA/Prc